MSNSNNDQTGRARAQKLIESIAKDRGHIRQESWEKLNRMDHALHEEIKGALSGVVGSLGAAVSILAKNLYTSNAQFVFELLQNAEDNLFTEAQNRNQLPYVEFRMYHDRMVVDCNENGFDDENVKAICEVGKTSKTGTEGYIGEKGIGFKSVFMAAGKVQIQSGDFSFHFRHFQGDSGMGMITPIWEDPVEELPPHFTRITLHFHETSDPQVSTTQRETIRQQLKDLQGDILLFMTKLQEIRISIFTEEGNLQYSAVFSARYPEVHRATVTKAINEDGQSKSTASMYHITKHVARNLPKNENRTYTESDETTKKYSMAQIVLAFPISSDSTPIVQQQKAFAFLPVDYKGFSFLIHSDFVTQANRQGIVVTSARNISLLDGIADAFLQATWQFCGHPTLQYTWMRYLPIQNKYPFDALWSRLVMKIKDKVRLTPLIRPGREEGLRLITELRQPKAWHLDGSGELLFEDLHPELSLSRRYQREDIQILNGFGLQALWRKDIIEMAERDIASDSSRMRSKNAEDDWHTRVSELFVSTLEEHGYSADLKSRVRKMPLLPLQSGEWVEQSKIGGIYFPEAEGIAIPGNLALNLISAPATANPTRLRLFKALGVRSVDVAYVRQKILERHRGWMTKLDHATIQDFVDHLKFLYLTHQRVGDLYRDIHDVVLIEKGNSWMRLPHTTDLYLPDESPFGPWALLRQGEGNGRSEKASGHSVEFIHDSYLQNIPEKPSQDSIPWRDWLVTHAGLRLLLRLTSKTASPRDRDLSPVCYYIAEHNPGMFLSFLAHHWPQEGKPIEAQTVLQDKLKALPVLCQDGQMVKLSATYLPLPDLNAQCTKFLIGKESFPFLDLEKPMERDTYAKDWGFLVRYLGVGAGEDIEFYLTILSQIRQTEAHVVKDCQRIVEIYSIIHGKYMQAGFQPTDKETIRNRFKSLGLVYVPTIGEEGPCWVEPERCLWEAPPAMKTKHSLKACFEEGFAGLPAVSLTIPIFFTDVLAIPNCNCFTLVEEFQRLAGESFANLYQVHDLYRHLDRMVRQLSAQDQSRVKQAFVQGNLIYAENNDKGSWYQISECLWSSEIEINGRTTLDHHYEDLRGLFVEFLGVNTLNLEMVCQELVQLGSSPTTTVDQVRPNIWVLNSFLSATTQHPNPKKLYKSRIFPVRYPDERIELMSATSEFAIVDRTYLGDIFEPLAKTLAFTFDEVRLLAPTIAWLGLGRRYMSATVIESTRVDVSDRIPLSDPGREIKIAYHFNSPRLKSSGKLYAILQNARVYETDGVSSELVLWQDGKPHPHEMSQSDLHIQEDSEQLEIFIPHNKKRQESCYAQKLPSVIFRWLMTDRASNNFDPFEEKGLRITGSVLNSSRSVIPDILEYEGIALGDFQDEYSEEEDGFSGGEESHQPGQDSVDRESGNTTIANHGTRTNTEAELGGATTSAASPPSQTTDPLYTPTTSQSVNQSAQRTQSSVSDRPGPFRFQSPLGQDGGRNFFESPLSQPQTGTANSYHGNVPWESDTNVIHARSDFAAVRRRSMSEAVPRPIPVDGQRVRYVEILKSVVSAARAASFPSQGSFNMTRMSDTLPNIEMESSSYDGLEQPAGFRSTSKLERDKKIGAAGELYVFELLKKLSTALPGFSMANWRSNIREYVSEHPEYALIQPWGPRETDDIIYDDVEGTFTELLIENGYLKEAWDGKKPHYLIEVKTTTGLHDTKFYMSKAQYRRMGNHRESTDTIYMIFRVFNADKTPFE